MFAATVVLVGLAVYSARFGDAPAARPFRLLMCTSAMWALFEAMSVSASELSSKVLWTRLQYVPLVFMPLLVLMLALAYIGRSRWITISRLAWLLAIPALSLILDLTSAHHTLFLYDFRLDTSGPVPALTGSFGPLLWLFVVYAEALLFGACGLLVSTVRARVLHLRSTVLILIGILLPVFVDLLWDVGITPIHDYNLAPAVLVVTGGLVTWVLLRERLFDVSPIARRVVMDGLDDPVVVVDLHNQIVDFNHAARIACGLARRFLGAAPDTLSPDWADLFRRSPEVVHKEEVTVGPAGSSRSYELTVSPIVDRRRVLGRLFILHDVTTRKRVEEALRESEEKYRSLFERANDGIVIIQEGLIKFANPSSARIRGAAPAALGGTPFVDYVDPAEAATLADRYRRRLAGEKLPSIYETMLRRDDGSRVPVEISAEAITYEGRPADLVIVRDTTERRRLEEQRLELEHRLHESQKLESLGVLAGGIAHDFNNILTGVLGNADLALRELPPSHPVRGNLWEIASASRRAADLCRQMLAYSGRGHFLVEPLDLSALTREMVSLLNSSVPKKARLRLDLEDALPRIEADASQLSQVVLNLVINAAEALEEKEGEITIKTALKDCSEKDLAGPYAVSALTPGPYVSLEVTDTCSGMDSKTQERIFEPFFSTKFTGRGLGLAAVLGIVRGHNGAITLKSRPGRGTTFTVLLPARSIAEEGLPVEASKGPPEETREWRGTGTVLLVDDEETVRSLGERMLGNLGFSVIAAADGRSAVQLWKEHRAEISLVLLDLMMPHLDGEETLSELQSLDSHVRVLLTSGYSDPDIAARFTDQPLVDFLPKPYTLSDLKQRLRDLLLQKGAA